MVIRLYFHVRRRAMLNLEVAVALAILTVAILPLAFLFTREGKLLRAYYRDAVAMQILDGEAEVLAAGEWRKVLEGRHDYVITARAATNLPPGRFSVTRSSSTLRIEWLPQKGRAMQREIILP